MENAGNASRPLTGPWFDINLAALCENYAMIARAAASAETAAVVKCDGYGLGADKVSQALVDRQKCNAFFVAYPEEGRDLRAALKSPSPAPKIYVFNGPTNDTIPLFEQNALTPVLNSLAQARDWAARMPNAQAAVHIDTGMNRLGAPKDDAAAIAALKNLRITLALSHLACSSTPDHPFNAQQRTRFLEAAVHFPDAKLSLAASGGALMGKDFHFDLVRPGIALYGGSPFDADDPRIKPVVALRAPILQLRTVAAGETVGYAARFEATAATELATVALGYGDGFPRIGFDRAEAEIGGARAPVAGMISMDLVTLDISTRKTPVSVGDHATFFGGAISLHEAAEACGTIPYELLTGLGARVDRRYVT